MVSKVPVRVRRVGSRVVKKTSAVAKWVWGWGKTALWVVGTSALVLSLPLQRALEVDMQAELQAKMELEMMENSKKQGQPMPLPPV